MVSEKMELRNGREGKKTAFVFINMLSTDTASSMLCCPNQAKTFSELYWKLGYSKRELHFIDAQAQILEITDLIPQGPNSFPYDPLDVSQSSSEPASAWRKSAVLTGTEGVGVERERGENMSSTPAPCGVTGHRYLLQICLPESSRCTPDPSPSKMIGFCNARYFHWKKKAFPIVGSYTWLCPTILFRILCHSQITTKSIFINI